MSTPSANPRSRRASFMDAARRLSSGTPNNNTQGTGYADLDILLEWKQTEKDGEKTYKVPKPVYDSLVAPYRGQSWGANHKKFLDHFFTEQALYVPCASVSLGVMQPNPTNHVKTIDEQSSTLTLK